MKTFRVWRDGAAVDLPEGDDNPYTLIAADITAINNRRVQWHVEAIYDGKRVARFKSVLPSFIEGTYLTSDGDAFLTSEGVAFLVAT